METESVLNILTIVGAGIATLLSGAVWVFSLVNKLSIRLFTTENKTLAIEDRLKILEKHESKDYGNNSVRHQFFVSDKAIRQHLDTIEHDINGLQKDITSVEYKVSLIEVRIADREKK